MRLVNWLGVAALAAGTVIALPGDAQRYHGDGYHRGYGNHGYGHRGGYGYGGGYGYRHGGYGYGHGGYGYRGGYGYGYGGRTICRVHRGYYGPVRRCFRAY